jgi:putative two-component system response regulator
MLNAEIVATQKEVITTLGELVETRSLEVANHVRRVGEHAQILGRLAGLSEAEAELLQLAAPMHDVGKVGIPDAILGKPGPVTSEEFEIIKRHTTIGHAILSKSSRRIMQAAAMVAHQHHERWDGRGYPQALAGEDIHVFGRITCLVDVFDALGHRRCYKDAWPLEQILELLREGRGVAFDPHLVDLFLDHLSEFLAVQDRYADGVCP